MGMITTDEDGTWHLAFQAYRCTCVVSVQQQRDLCAEIRHLKHDHAPDLALDTWLKKTFREDVGVRRFLRTYQDVVEASLADALWMICKAQLPPDLSDEEIDWIPDSEEWTTARDAMVLALVIRLAGA